MNPLIQDYLHAVRHQLTPLGLREREAVLKEIEDHLRTEVRRLRKEDDLSEDEAALHATHAFGDPSEIGVAYGAGGGVVNRSTGELLLDVAILSTRAAGRGVRGVLKWTGIVAACTIGVALILVVAGLIFADSVIETFQDDIRESIPHPLYEFYGSWGVTDPHTDMSTQTFQVREEIKEFTFSVYLAPSSLYGGCAQITLVAPDDSIAYQSGLDCSAESTTFTLHQQGTWQVQYVFAAFSGTVDIDAFYFEETTP